ncbi:MAG TPA: SDR family oxidoreductase, partial [Candidatus Binataceae bacterium]|nr:SDR family oxidoreductase [Candidatus Binataceae bacterium]
MATALITGASSGLGEEFARQLARENYDLVLTARREDRLKTVAAEATKLGSSKVEVIASDLGQANAAAKLHQQVTQRGIEIECLVNNAGFGTHGMFHKLPLDREVEEINLNITSLVAMTRLFLDGMVARQRGTIINVASTAAFQPVPYMATYGASKSFVLDFSEAVAFEVKSSGVTVMALCPGPTRTEFQDVAGVNENGVPSFAYMDAKTVVAQALASAKRGKSVRINGIINSVMAQSTRFAPRSMVARIAGAMFKG